MADKYDAYKDGDPYGSFNFHVKIDGADDALAARFSEVSGLKGDVEVFEIKEGGLNDRTRTFPGRVTWGPVTLKRGIDADKTFYDWWRAIVENKSSAGDRRKKVTIQLLDEDFSTKQTWVLANAWPKSWESASLNAGGSDLAFETVVLSHDGIEESKS